VTLTLRTTNIVWVVISGLVNSNAIFVSYISIKYSFNDFWTTEYKTVRRNLELRAQAWSQLRPWSSVDYCKDTLFWYEASGVGKIYYLFISI